MGNKPIVTNRAVETACSNSTCIAVVISPSVVMEKYSPDEAQLCMFFAIWRCHGVHLAPMYFLEGAKRLIY